MHAQVFKIYVFIFNFQFLPTEFARDMLVHVYLFGM
jgi:hypothetical protein